jgi:DNA polymerase (family X)
MVQGVKDANIDAYLAQIEEARRAVPDIAIFAGAEVDILEDGSLYLSDETMRRLDWVTASVHGHFKMSSPAMTERLLRALEHPSVRLLGHPTGRLLQKREPIAYDTQAVFAKAAERKIALEINASPFRLDLNDVLARKAKDAGALLAINSDGHSPGDLDYRYGIAQARRGWLRKDDVVNAKSLEEFQLYLQR